MHDVHEATYGGARADRGPRAPRRHRRPRARLGRRRRLGTSQPTLSRALARCEAELGARLFDRVPDGVRATPAGTLVVDAARDLVTRYGQLVASLDRVLGAGSGLVRLAFLDSMATSLVPSLLRAFHAHAPAVRVQLRQEPAHEIAQGFALGAVDLAITSVVPDGPYGWHVLQEERLVLVVPAAHPWRDRDEVGLDELGADELITTPAGFGHRQLVDGLLREAGVAPAVSFESQDLATIEGLVAAGLGVAVVPEAFAGQSGTVGLALTSPGARRTIGLTWRTDRSLTPAGLGFRDFVVGTRG